MRSEKIPGWGLVSAFRPTDHGQEALVVFEDEEAPHWMPYSELAAIRRRILQGTLTDR
jgi:hypothetical protein